MIKTKINNEYKDIIKIFGGDTLQKEITKVWSREANKYVYESEVEYTGPLPITITADGTALIDYKIYGNTVQAGTPTPEAPVDVVGCGERVDITGLSEPLCGIGTYTDSLDLSTGTLTRRIKKLVLTGEEKFIKDGVGEYLYYIKAMHMYHTNCLCSHLASTTGYPTYQIGCSTYNNALIFYLNFGADVMNAQPSGNTVAGLEEYLAAQYAAGTPVTIWYVLAEPEVSTILVPSGMTGTIEGYLIQDGTPTPETPIYPIANGIKQSDGTYSIEYGYKLPILSNSTVTNIYLGEVETTRRIKKLVLTGEENWSLESVDNFYTTSKPAGAMFPTKVVCSHQVSAHAYYLVGVENVWVSATGNLNFTTNAISHTADDFKSYLAAQYAAGTPVTIWYVLANEETGIVNEPLMKIGDYADTLSMEQADVSIPTFAGTTVIDYDGTPKPSMYIKYRR